MSNVIIPNKNHRDSFSESSSDEDVKKILAGDKNEELKENGNIETKLLCKNILFKLCKYEHFSNFSDRNYNL